MAELTTIAPADPVIQTAEDPPAAVRYQLLDSLLANMPPEQQAKFLEWGREAGVVYANQAPSLNTPLRQRQ